MRKLIIYCEGGFGNRMCSMLGGLVAADKIGINEVNIIWPISNWCNCSYEKIFLPQFKILTDVDKIFKENLQNIFLTHTSEKKFKYVFKHDGYIIEKIREMSEDVVYNNNRIPKYAKNDEIISKLKSIKINKSIRNVVYEFCEKNKIDNSVIGLHLRRTDSGYDKMDDEKYLNVVKKLSEKRFFVCSDDLKTEKMFNVFKNVIVFKKTDYVEKLNKNKDWAEYTYNENNTMINAEYNIKRNENSIIQAVIDMLILSRTNLEEYKSFGSFYMLACFYSKIKI